MSSRSIGIGVVVALVLLPGGSAAAQTTNRRERRGLESIKGAEALETIKILADDAMEGRDSGSKGGRLAADYVAGRFKRLGLKPLGDDGKYLQAFPAAAGKQSHNVLGLLKGGDRRLRSEIVVVGAHHDHIGHGTGGLSRLGGADIGKIHNGADDNASGVAALLEIAEAFRKAKLVPKRSVLFATFSAEERGLLGSRYYVENPALPLGRVVAMINLDTVGRGETGSFQVYGIGTAALLETLTTKVEVQLEKDLGRDLRVHYGRSGAHASDNKPFHDRGIPVLLLHTGFHEQYHTPRDDWHRINQRNLEIVARWGFLLVTELAIHAEERPVFRSVKK